MPLSVDIIHLFQSHFYGRDEVFAIRSRKQGGRFLLLLNLILS